MKIKDEYVLQNIADRWVVIETNTRSVNFNKILSLNGSGRFLWEKLENGASHAELETALVAEFGIDADRAKADAAAFVADRAKADAAAFVAELEKLGCIDDE